MKYITTLLATLVAAAAVSTSNAALLLHYTFDTADISGTTVTDLGTGGNDGSIITTTVTTQTGKFGDALLFGLTNTAAADAVDVGTALLSTTNASQAYTISYWMKSSTGGTVVSQYGNIGETNRFGTLHQGSGSRWFHNGGADFTGTTDTLDDAWHHVVFVKNADQTVNVFVDKNDETPGTVPVDGVAFLNKSTLIGTLRYTGSGDLLTFEGLIDEVQIYDEALGQSEINALFSSNAIPEPSSAVLSLVGLLALVGRRRRS